MSYNPIITQAGLNAAVTAETAGLKVDLAHIAIGDAGWTPTRDATSLLNERDRVAIAGSSVVGQAQRHLTTVFQTQDSFAVREVGFYLSDGTLFAVWSHPTNVLFYQSLMSKIVQGFDLMFTGVPVDAINVNVTGDLNIYYASEFASIALASMKMAIAQIQSDHRQIQINQRLLTMEKS